MIGTINNIKKRLYTNGFLKRYSCKDDFSVTLNAFISCTFWFVESLYLSGEKAEAIRIFENLLKHSNHLKLLSEDIDPRNGELLGNFPQGYSHAALINAVFTLSGKVN